MTIDIFYEQLKYEKVSQVKAYEVTQFVSKYTHNKGYYFHLNPCIFKNSHYLCPHPVTMASDDSGQKILCQYSHWRGRVLLLANVGADTGL